MVMPLATPAAITAAMDEAGPAVPAWVMESHPATPETNSAIWKGAKMKAVVVPEASGTGGAGGNTGAGLSTGWSSEAESFKDSGGTGGIGASAPIAASAGGTRVIGATVGNQDLCNPTVSC